VKLLGNSCHTIVGRKAVSWRVNHADTEPCGGKEKGGEDLERLYPIILFVAVII